nr:hypothetical protein [Rhodoferax sp. UBA5149]
MSWHTMMEFEPPLVGCVVSGHDFSFTALKATRTLHHRGGASSWWLARRSSCHRRCDKGGAGDRVPPRSGHQPRATNASNSLIGNGRPNR